ncbi:MAG: ornithine cyclodeaminase family protein [Pseudomonadota bacterium]
MRLVNKQEILAQIDEGAVLAEIEEGFRRFARDEAQVAPVTHLAFPKANGECHIKCAHVGEDDVFTVKLATGFYDNPEKGLSSSNGFMAVISAQTGTPLAILQDEGALTDLRTALAGVIAGRLGARQGAKALGVIGTGIQARLQAQLYCRLLGFTRVTVWGRSEEKAATLTRELSTELDGVPVTHAQSVEALCADVDVIVTATASREAIIKSEFVQPGTHIVAVGADSPGKQELDTALFARASHVIVDSLSQCTEHGETANAIASRDISPDRLITLGQVLLEKRLGRADEAITIADLTGVAVQDAAIAKSVWFGLKSAETGAR